VLAMLLCDISVDYFWFNGEETVKNALAKVDECFYSIF
jgi:hypothetical protein